MAYQKDKPQPNNKLKNSQGDLLGNFQALNDAFEVNHDISTFTSPAAGDEGKHKFVTFVRQSSDPGVAGTDVYLYTKDASGSQLFIQKANGTPVNLTSGSQTFTDGFFFTPQGYVVRFGRLTATGTTTVVWPTAFLTQPFVVQLTIDSTTANPVFLYWDQSTTTNTNLGVRIINSSGADATATFYFYAIAVQV